MTCGLLLDISLNHRNYVRTKPARCTRSEAGFAFIGMGRVVSVPHRRSSDRLAQNRIYDGRRGSARERGYTAAWDKAARLFKKQHPLCCMCEKEGRTTPTFAVDHIKPHRGDMTLFWDPNNWQPLCRDHHNRAKQSEERLGYSSAVGDDGWPVDDLHPANSGKQIEVIGTAKSHPVWFRKSFVPLHIVCGAPGSGKSTYVDAHAGPDDRIICFDRIATLMFGRPGAARAHAVLDGSQVGDVLRARNEAIADLMWESAASKWPAAWLIVSEAKAKRRQWWADRLEPHEVIVMMTPAATCRARVVRDAADGDVRAKNVGQTIDKWWRDYTRREGDVLVR